MNVWVCVCVCVFLDMQLSNNKHIFFSSLGEKQYRRDLIFSLAVNHCAVLTRHRLGAAREEHILE